MTREEVRTLLRGFVREWRIDPHDAGEIWREIPADGIDRETLGDKLDGAGYPELARVVYGVVA